MTYKKWTKKDIELLKENYGKISSMDLCKLLNRKRQTIYNKAISIELVPSIKRDRKALDNLYNCGIKILEFDGVSTTKNGSKKVKCECPACGKEFYSSAWNIVSGHTKGCGCANYGRRTGGKYISGKYWKQLYRSAVERRLVFNISIDYIEELLEKQEFRCALSNVKLEYSYDTNKQTLSLDRIDSLKGYVEDNVQWVHKDINMMKQSYSQEYFIDFCIKVADNAGNKFNRPN